MFNQYLVSVRKLRVLFEIEACEIICRRRWIQNQRRPVVLQVLERFLQNLFTIRSTPKWWCIIRLWEKPINCF